MIVYQQAFDIYHTVYRLLCLLDYFNRGESVELDRLRIWDFYLLFPNKIQHIKLRRDEDDVKRVVRNLITKKENPYEEIPNVRVMFEKIQAYQLTAIKCLASYGIINLDFLSLQRVTVINKEELHSRLKDLPKLSETELNAVKLLTSHFYLIPMYGEHGLKQRTSLLESRYDAQ